MKIGKTLYVKDRKAWRAWLKEHHRTEPEIWLIYYKKESGKPRVSYNDAVEEALCFGWIDSTMKSVDFERLAQRFTPRRKTSNLSEPNKVRIRKLIAQRKMTKAGLEAVAHAFDPKKDADGGDVILPPYIEIALKENDAAWENYLKFPDTYKRVRIQYIETRKRHGPEHVQRALGYFIKMTAANKRYGFIKE
jgi:uncharacterized protein YdeI (YjbR/CyaY-like superfamily)